MTTVVISQPMYFPWAGFLAHMALADVFIWLDDAQFSKGSFTNRVQVKTSAGPKWMSIPLVGQGAFREIRAVEAAPGDWAGKHRSLFQQALSGRPHLPRATALFDGAVAHDRLVDVLIASAEGPANAMGILPAKITKSSDMNIPGTSWTRVLDLVRAVGGTRYVTGHGAMGYLDHEAFESAGVSVDYMDYAPAPWPQGHGAFTPYVTNLDLLAAVPEAEAAAYLRPSTLGWRQFQASREASS